MLSLHFDEILIVLQSYSEVSTHYTSNLFFESLCNYRDSFTHQSFLVEIANKMGI